MFIQTHYSSMLLRTVSPVDNNGLYYCISCKTTPHTVKSGIRYPVILTGSSMHDWSIIAKQEGYESDSIHIDIISIPGATIKQLHHALEVKYGKADIPLDNLVVAGLNDILRGHSVDQIKDDYMNLILWSQKQSGTCPGKMENTCAIATLPYPPKCTQYEEDPRPPMEKNKQSTITGINQQISYWNVIGNPYLKTDMAPMFHTWGTMKRTRREFPFSGGQQGAGHGDPGPVTRSFKVHKWCSWREKEVENMLHLNNLHMIKMGKAAVKYFTSIY